MRLWTFPRVVGLLLVTLLLCAAGLTTLTSPAAAQDPLAESSELDAAIATWESRLSDEYTIAYRYCLAPFGCQEQELQFADGQLISGTDLINGGDPFWTFNVDDLHLDMEEALTAGANVAEGSYDSNGVPTSYLIDLFPGGGANDMVSFELISFRFDSSAVNILAPTVTCLAGNGRIDVNIVNEGSSAATYQLQIGALPVRQSTVAPKSWWRSPVTGRPDGFISVVVRRDGVTVLDETVLVSCDGPSAGVSQPEVQFFTWCIGGNGIIFAQMANPTGAPRSYILDVNGIRRSTTAAAYGAAFRGISGRPNGSYEAVVFTGALAVASATVDVNC